jgi:hypothetical protein
MAQYPTNIDQARSPRFVPLAILGTMTLLAVIAAAIALAAS